MKHILAIGLLAISLGACQGIKFGQFVQTIESAATGTVSPEAIYIARNAFDTVEVSATNYLRLKKCGSASATVICRDAGATAKLIPAIRAGRVARNNATQFLKDHPNQLGTQGLYDALISSTDTIKQILAQYNAGG